jgi:hypothetical protein
VKEGLLFSSRCIIRGILTCWLIHCLSVHSRNLLYVLSLCSSLTIYFNPTTISVEAVLSVFACMRNYCDIVKKMKTMIIKILCCQELIVTYFKYNSNSANRIYISRLKSLKRISLNYFSGTRSRCSQNKALCLSAWFIMLRWMNKDYYCCWWEDFLRDRSIFRNTVISKFQFRRKLFYFQKDVNTFLLK